MSEVDRYLDVIAGVGENLTKFARDAKSGTAFETAFGKIKSTDDYTSKLESELARLRAAASEADALRAVLSDLLAVIHRDGGQHEQEHGRNSALIAQRIVAELYTEHDALRATVAEQAKQIEAARILFEIMSPGEVKELGARAFGVLVGETRIEVLFDLSIEFFKRASAWLAANAPLPAPEAERTA